MEPHDVDSIVCPSCYASLPAAARRCDRCGASTQDEPVAPPAPAPKSHAPKLRLQERPWFVLVILFGVALFLGYPLLWQSPSFSRRAKVVLTVLVALWSVVVFGGFFLVMRWSYQRVVDAW